MNRLTAISGLGGKGPACFLIESGGRRLLLDFGEGPQPGLLPDIDAIGPVDALLLSHQHADHLGALRFLPRIGNPPIFASAYVARNLSLPAQSLPLHGQTTVCGLAVATGRSGHAPGGVWLHVAVGDGLLYMGDNCAESPLYVDDAPPPAATMILDASYGAYDAPYADCEAALDALVAKPGRLLLPLPAQGRGPEIALYLLRRGVAVYLDDENRKVVAALLQETAPPLIRGEARGDLARLLTESAPSPDAAKAIVVSPATLKSELAQCLIAEQAAGADIRIVFTGYTPPGTPAGYLLESKRAEFLRWNIHPRLRDNAALVHHVGAKQVMPAFGEADEAQSAWQEAFAPARIVLSESCEL
jgi:Cft2 family RNA processing exonuclease